MYDGNAMPGRDCDSNTETGISGLSNVSEAVIRELNIDEINNNDSSAQSLLATRARNYTGEHHAPPQEPPAYHDMLLEEPTVSEPQWYSMCQLSLCKTWRAVADPMNEILSKFGPSMMAGNIIYMMVMTSIAAAVFIESWYVSREPSSGISHDVLLSYASKHINFAKLDVDMEYLNRMRHSSGTRGDLLVQRYIEHEFTRYGMLPVLAEMCESRVTFPSSGSHISVKANNSDSSIILDLDENNFNPYGINGICDDAELIYGRHGRLDELEQLADQQLLPQKYVLLLNYDKHVSEQILAAQRYNACGIIFISDNSRDNVQRRSVAIPQCGTSVWQDVTAIQSVPQIPTIPISEEVANQLLNLLHGNGIRFDNDYFSGRPGTAMVNLQVKTEIRTHHLVGDVITKLNGKEDDELGLIVMASRDSFGRGSRYPDFGTSMLMLVGQLLQQLKYEFNWRPRRSIYIFSAGGSDYNYAGTYGLLQNEGQAVISETFAVLDISQVGIWNDRNELQVQTHPLLGSYLRDVDYGMMNAKVIPPGNFDDTFPFVSTGIPSVVISMPEVEKREMPIGTSQDNYDSIRSILENPAVTETRIQSLVDSILRIVLGIADDPYIPFNITDYLQSMSQEMNELLASHFKGIDASNMQHIIKNQQEIVSDYESWMKEDKTEYKKRLKWNRFLASYPKQHTSAQGLQNRSEYKNILWGPPLWSQKWPSKTIGAWMFPGIKDSIDNVADESEIKQQLDFITKLLNKTQLPY